MDPYLRKKDWLRGPGRSGRDVRSEEPVRGCSVRSVRALLAFAGLLCDRGSDAGHAGCALAVRGQPCLRERGSSRCSFFLRSSRDSAALATGASVGGQNGSSPGSPWSATASSPSSGARVAARLRKRSLLSASRRGGVRPAANGQLGTGTDRGNPTV